MDSARIGWEDETGPIFRPCFAEAATTFHENTVEQFGQRIAELEIAISAHDDAIRMMVNQGFAHGKWHTSDAVQLAGYEAEPQAKSAELSDEEPAPRPGRMGTAKERELERLKEQVRELEVESRARADAARTLASQKSSAGGGSKLSEFVTFSGNLETQLESKEDFEGGSESKFSLASVQLEFEIRVNTWSSGHILLDYDDGAKEPFLTTEGTETFVDRINVDQAYLNIGDLQKCPLYGEVGRMTLPFGISTGHPLADTLTVEDPLTIEVFEMARRDAGLIGFEFLNPRPCPGEPPPPATPVRPVEPILFRPILAAVGGAANHFADYCPIQRALPATPSPIPWTAPCGLHGGVYFFNGDPIESGNIHVENMGGTFGYRMRGTTPYRCIPWSLQMDVDAISSVFASQFLTREYRPFLAQIGEVPGMAAHVKSALGPFSLVCEWNGAVEAARFTDGLGAPVSIVPSAWQAQLAYQFNWNPTVEKIGEQGTFCAFLYSESQDLAGVTRVVDGHDKRVGFVPQRRLIASLGEWVWEGARVEFEYIHNLDYSIEDGGTGNSADGFLVSFAYQW